MVMYTEAIPSITLNVEAMYLALAAELCLGRSVEESDLPIFIRIAGHYGS